MVLAPYFFLVLGWLRVRFPWPGCGPDGRKPGDVHSRSRFEATKMFQLTGEAETMTAGLPKNDATITVIMANKHAGGTAMAETMTAMPTLTLTPTIPPNSPVSQTGDLQAQYRGAMGATGTLIIGVGLTNAGAHPCFIQIRPQAVFVDRNGKLLDLQYSYSPRWDTPVDPQAMLGLPPGRSAGFSVQFGNLCIPKVSAGLLSVRVTLAGNGGMITVPTDLSIEPGCSAPGSGIWVGISPFSMP